MSDKLTRFLFDNHSVRGQIIRLTDTFNSAMLNKQYPEFIQQLLGEMLATCGLLSATLKFEGEISLQIQSEGYIKYAVVHATHDLKLKSVVRLEEDADFAYAGFRSMFKKGYMAITITPKQGERYQGIVGLNEDSFNACIEDYFIQSEQLPTKLYLFTESLQGGTDFRSGGIFLQVIPDSYEASMASVNESISHLSLLAETMAHNEFFAIDEEQILYRLFNQEQVRLLEKTDVVYACDCSKSRTARALINIDKSQLDEILAEDGVVRMNCHFCSAEYVFDAIDIGNIQAGNTDFEENQSAGKH